MVGKMCVCLVAFSVIIGCACCYKNIVEAVLCGGRRHIHHTGMFITCLVPVYVNRACLYVACILVIIRVVINILYHGVYIVDCIRVRVICVCRKNIFQCVGDFD